MSKKKKAPLARCNKEGKSLGVYKREKAGYEVSVDTGECYLDGRKKYKRALVNGSRKEAKDKEKQMLLEILLLRTEVDKLKSEMPIQPEDIKHSEPVDSGNSKDTFKEIAESWINKKKAEIRFKTWKRYKQILDMHMIDFFVKEHMQEFEEEDFEQYFLEKSKINSNNSLRQHYVILGGIFELAKKKKIVPFNIVKDVKKPKYKKPETKCIENPEKLSEFLHNLRGSIIFFPSYISACTGARMSEILGLRWSDIDLENQYISIKRSLHWSEQEWYMENTKNEQSTRTLKISKKDVKIFSEFKDKQKGKAGDFVCLNSKGDPFTTSSLSSNFRRRARVLGYNISFHSLRHSHVTVLILHQKMPVKLVSERLGHENIEVTLKIYSHVVKEQQEILVEKMEEILKDV